MSKRFSKTKVLIIGDIIIDKFVFGTADKLTFEAPIPLVEIEDSNSKLGGAGLVIENCKNLGVDVIYVGAIDNNSNGKWIKQKLNSMKVKSHFFEDKNKKISIRTRIFSNNRLVCMYQEKTKKLAESTEKKIIKKIESITPTVNCVIVCDYGKNSISVKIIEILKQLAKSNDIVVSPVENHLMYIDSNFIFRIKLKDAQKLFNVDLSKQSSANICKKLSDMIKSDKIIITDGENGLLGYDNGDIHQILPTRHKSRDFTSVGEILVSTFAVSLGSGMTFENSCLLGNIAAGIAIEKTGIKTVSKKELFSELRTVYDLEFQK
jgi:rfaE bifunctional protein kinase chain/domain